MKKFDYLLNTSRGNYSMYRKRFERRLFFRINQEPYSKKSMRQTEKQQFQQEIDHQMRTKKRSAFRGPVVLQMDFFPKRGNPSSIHHLAKNYLDLLYPRESRGLRFPMLDDRQVSILIVNYHVQFENDQPEIQITMAPMRDFIEDLKLYERIRTGTSFIEDDGDYDYDPEELFNKDGNFDRDFDRAIENFRDYKKFETECNIPPNLELERMYIRDIQSLLLSRDKFTPYDLSTMFTKETKGIFGTFFREHRKLILSTPFSPLQPIGLPTQEGGTNQFKQTVREMVYEYAKRYPFLGPVLVNMTLTILYIPPRNQEIDLDNLARYIVPTVNEAVKPPAGYWFNDVPQKFPRHTIIQYQVIKLPRSTHDPEDGLASLVLSECNILESSIWSESDKLIDKWSDKVF